VSHTITGRSEAITEDVVVRVEARYVPEQSTPSHRQFLFSYTVTIVNRSRTAVKLLTRHWIIKDAVGDTQRVEGVGVVGETPTIAPGKSHSYSSFCPLRTEFGTMEGSYGMIRVTSGDTETFRAQIAPFSLRVPTAVN